ncbi:unnamed protein product [Rhizopus stolonifer]
MALVAMLNSQENLNRIFNDLKSKNEDKRFKAAEELRETAETASRELSEENFVQFTNDINKRFSNGHTAMTIMKSSVPLLA